MSAAYASSLDISFEVRAGLVMRQMHHWAALIFLAALVVHMCRVFFTGAFRRPREINWIVGVTLFVLSIINGFFGYSLLDDLLSGTGVRVGYSIALSIPVAGEWLAFLFFGGEFPNTEFITRFFVLHVLLLPAAIAGLLGAHLAILWRQKHTQFRGPGRTEDNIEGSHLWPSYAAKSIGLFFIVTGVLAALGGLAQINPVWLYGPYDPAQASAATAGSQPDWYVGWLDGALRIMPGWEIRAFGHTIANPFFPGAVLPGHHLRPALHLAVAGAPVHQGPGPPTTCSTGPVTPRSAPASAPPRWPSTRSCSSPAATTCWRRCSRWPRSRSPTCSGS